MKISTRCNLQGSINSDRSQGCAWFNKVFKQRYQLGIVWLLVKFYICNSFKELSVWGRTKAAHQLRRGGHFLFAYKKAFIISLQISTKTRVSITAQADIKFNLIIDISYNDALTWYPCHGNLPLIRKINVYASDSRSSLLLPVRPKCACTLAYLIVPLPKEIINILNETNFY